MENSVDNFDLNSFFEKKLKEEIDKVKKDFIDSEKLSVESFFDSRDVFSLIRQELTTYIQNEIGNRLRNGLYDNLLVKKIFDEKFEKILKQQLTQEMHAEIKELIKTEFRTLISKL